MFNAWELLKKKANSGDQEAERLLAEYKKYNASIGNAFTQVKEQVYPIKGRETEIDRLYSVQVRKQTPVACLIGLAGSGKTSIVEQFVKDMNTGAYARRTGYRVFNKFVVMSLRIGRLSYVPKNQMQAVITTMFDVMKKFELRMRKILADDSIRFVVFADEVHLLVTIFGEGTKIGGDILKDILINPPVKFIGATTRAEFDTYIATDPPLAQRFKEVPVNVLPQHEVHNALAGWWKAQAVSTKHYPLSDELIDYIISANASMRSQNAEPRKSIDILEDLLAYEDKTGKRVNKDVIAQVFRSAYNISLENRWDADKIIENLNKNIKGQEFARGELGLMLQSLKYPTRGYGHRPIMSALFTGSTGVGKTETVKIIANTLYPNENVLNIISMTDYQTPDREPAFRKKIGEIALHQPNAVLLFDEIEKACQGVFDTLLFVLDEGNVTYETEDSARRTNVQNVSLTNTCVFVTTNEGSEVFTEDAQHSVRATLGTTNSDTEKEEYRNLSNMIFNSLIASGKFRAEFLGRFDRIIPFRSLSANEYVAITKVKLNELLDSFSKIYNVNIHLDAPIKWSETSYNCVENDVVIYISYILVKANNPQRGGARSVARYVDREVKDGIVQALIANPDCHDFRMYVSKDNRIYDSGAADTKGGIVVEPMGA